MMIDATLTWLFFAIFMVLGFSVICWSTMLYFRRKKEGKNERANKVRY